MTPKNDTNSSKKKRSFLKRLLSGFVLFVLFIAIVVSLFITFLAYNTSFRQTVITKVMGIVNTQLTAQVEVGDIHLIGFGGFKLDNVKLITTGDTLAVVDEIIGHIAIAPILDNHIQVSKLILNNPRIMLLRRKSDSSWNFERIAPPSTTTDTTQTTMTIDLNNFEIRNGLFYMIDSLQPELAAKKFDPSRMKFDSLSLKLDAAVDLGANNYSAKIKKIALLDRTSQIKLKHLAGKLKLNEEGIYAENLDISTPDWKAVTDLTMEHYNVFGTESEQNLDSAYFEIYLKTKDFDPDFIKHFADLPIEIKGKHDVYLRAKGQLNSLDVEKMKLHFDDTYLLVTGKLDGLLEDKLKYEFALDSTFIYQKDIVNNLPFLPKANLPNFNKVYFSKLDVVGDTRKVSVDLVMTSGLGNASGDASLDFAGLLKYEADLTTQDFNLAKIINDPAMSSNLDADIKVKGSGTTLDDLNATVYVVSNASDFAGYHYDNLLLKASYRAQDSLIIDTLRVELPNREADRTEDVFNQKNARLTLSGAADVSDINHPSYDFQTEFEAINLKRLLNNPELPSYFTGNLSLVGEGINLDDIQAELNIHFDEMLLQDKAMMPFDIAASISIIDDSTRDISLTSDFVNASIKGHFKTSDLINSFAIQGQYLANFLKDKMDLIFMKQKNENPVRLRLPNGEFANIDCELNLEVKDVTPLFMFVKGIDGSATLATQITIRSTPKESLFIIDSLNIENVHFNNESMDFKTNLLSMDAVLSLAIQDSVPKFLYIDIFTESKDKIIFNDLLINEPKANLTFDGDTLDFQASADINNEMRFATLGNLDLTSPVVKLTIDSLMFAYQNQFAWYNKTPLKFGLVDESIDIEQFALYRPDAEDIKITGKIDKNVASDVRLTVGGLAISDLSLVMDKNKFGDLKKLEGDLDTLTVLINGPLAAPNIDLLMEMKNITFDKDLIGNFTFDVNYKDKNITGFAKVNNPELDSMDLLDIQINSLPIYLGTDSKEERFPPAGDMDIVVNMKYFPLQLASPFVPAISNLQGMADAKIVIVGDLPSNFNYSGQLSLRNAGFTLQATNVTYTVNGEINLEKDLIKVNNMVLKNLTQDLRNGQAEIEGFIKLKDFQPEELDFSIKADKLLVLSDATAISMPNLYGKFIIGTEARPIRFYGTLDKPNLEGDIVVIEAELKMPEVQSQQTIRTTFAYEVTDKSRIFKFTSARDTTMVSETDSTMIPLIKNEKVDIQDTRSLADLINYDLSIKIKDFTLLFDLGTLGEIYGKIGTSDPSIPMRYVKNRYESAPKLYRGELVLKEGSTVKIFRILETTGSISFPTGSLDNPTLNLQALYNGTDVDGTYTTNYTVFVSITGTKEIPILKLDYTVNGEHPTGDTKKIEQDAFALLATGKTKSGLGGGLGNTDYFGQGLNMGISQVASKSLTELLLGTGVIQSADISFGAEGLQDAKVNLSGSLSGIGNWTVGGNLSDLSSNYEASIEIPISVSSDALSNIVLQLSKMANFNLSSAIQDAKDFEVKIKVGGSW